MSEETDKEILNTLKEIKDLLLSSHEELRTIKVRITDMNK